MKKKVGIFLVALFFTSTMGITFFTRAKAYERGKAYDNPTEVIEKFFNSWNYNKSKNSNHVVEKYPEGFRDVLSDRLNAKLSVQNYVKLPDNSSYKAKLVEYSEVTDEKVLQQFRPSNKIIGYDFSKPDKVKFYKIKYLGLNPYDEDEKFEETERIYTLIEKDGHWYIDNFGQDFVFRMGNFNNMETEE